MSVGSRYYFLLLLFIHIRFRRIKIVGMLRVYFMTYQPPLLPEEVGGGFPLLPATVLDTSHSP